LTILTRKFEALLRLANTLGSSSVKAAGNGVTVAPSYPAGLNSNDTRSLRYRADIDGLRAIAVLLVVVFHIGLLGVTGVVLLWGDSFAAQYVPGIEDNAASMTPDILQYTASSCPPVFGFYTFANVRCREFNHHVLQIVRSFNIRGVMARWENAFKRYLDASEIASTVLKLRNLGLDAYVIGQSPMFGNDV